ncbi:schwannomin-interacting protein 1 homolog isoform X2 [Zerene cesonia]|uniref:schwannomin-interacting protein 1 homolog isoform X2 n=1 Tax=Zerene cesonia TaxID=33412 RepID=UPI0018E51D8A|nr:schwannomin-interacting protein 1 homolog isoform X2 [Zerene cesonia]
MRILNKIDNGNVATINKNDNFIYEESNRESWQIATLHQTNNTVDNYNSFNIYNNTDIVDNRILFTTENTGTDVSVQTAVCNHQYRINSQNIAPVNTTIQEEYLTAKTNELFNTTSIDGEQSLDLSDTEDMSDDSVPPVPRGIVNPNYPGFQHLAHTLQEYSINIESFYQSENEMTDDDVDAEITDIQMKCNGQYEEMNNNNSSKDMYRKLSVLECQHPFSSNIETRIGEDIPDLIKTITTNNNNEELTICDITTFDTDIENNFNTKDIIGDFNKEIEDEIKQLLNYNINIQDDLEELRKDIKDNFEKPIENTINNISEVVNGVIKKLVKTEVCDEIEDCISTTDSKQLPKIKKESEVNVKTNVNLSRPSFLLLDNNNQITDAVLSDGKEEINLNEDEYDTEKLSQNVESTIKQLSTELRKIIPKLNEMRERDKLWSERPIITDTNSNRIVYNSSNSFKSKKDLRYDTHFESKLTRPTHKINYHRELNKNTTKAQNVTTDPSIGKSNCNAQMNKSVQQDNVITDSDFESFDVYNIETALPKLDIDAIENHIKAAKEAERRKRNDREEIRKRLAMGVESDEYYSLGHIDRPGKKPSLHSRLQNGKNLQICFMNETASDNESQTSDMDRNLHSETKSLSRSSLFSKSTFNHPYQTRPLSVNITRNDKINTHHNGFKFNPGSFISKSSKSRSSQSLNHIELKESDFYALQSTLQTEARIALAQAKEMARIQMEHERRSRPVSPVTEMLRRSMEKANVPLAPDRRRVSRQILTDMNIAQLQVIVNELHSQIESLNDTLVKLLMARDELHMGQDSMLVDIEDLTRGVKEQTKKSKGVTTKSGVRRLTSLVHK